MKNEPWRSDPAAYGAGGDHGGGFTLQPRYTDVDTRRHVNNVAVYALHLEARVRRLMQALDSREALPTPLPRPRSVVTEFVLETHYPEDLRAGARLLPTAAPGSAALATGLFQQGRCVGLQECHLAAWSDDGSQPLPLPPAVAAALHGSGPAPAPAFGLPELGARLTDYPSRIALPSRYSDYDTEGGCSEPAVMRAVEQGRHGVLSGAFVAAGQPAELWTTLVVARIALAFAHHRAPPPCWRIGGGVVQLGRSSALLRVGLFEAAADNDAQAACQVVADSVMVYCEPGSTRSAEIPPPLRAALQALQLRAA